MTIKKTIHCRCCGGTGHEYDHTLVGRLMKARRDKSGKTQYQVARRLHCSKAWISALEGGWGGWNDKLIADYQKALK